ncbi:MAG: ankyrin repeat domain-containing protein, partial [Janthinobacterium lividum]
MGMKLFNHPFHRTASFDAAKPEPGRDNKENKPSNAFNGRDLHPSNSSGLHAGLRKKLFGAMFSGNPAARSTMTHPTADVVPPSSGHPAAGQPVSNLSTPTGAQPSAGLATDAGRQLHAGVTSLVNYCDADGASLANASLPPKVRKKIDNDAQAAKVISAMLTMISKDFRPGKREERPTPQECAAALQMLLEHRPLITERLQEEHAQLQAESPLHLNRQLSTERKFNALIERLFMHARGEELKRATLFQSQDVRKAREQKEYELAEHQTASIRAMLDPKRIEAIPRSKNPDRSPQLNHLLSIGRMLGELPATRRAELLPDVIRCAKDLNIVKGMYSPMLMATEAAILGLTVAQASHSIAALGLAAGLIETVSIHMSTMLLHIPEAMLGNGVARTTARRGIPYLVKQGPLHMELGQIIEGTTHFEHKLHSHGLELVIGELKHFRAAMLAGKLTHGEWEKETGKLMASVKEFIRTDLGAIMMSTKRVDLLKTLLKLLPNEMQAEIGKTIHETRISLTEEQWAHLGIHEGTSGHEIAQELEAKTRVMEQIAFRQAEAWKMLRGFHGDRGCEALHDAAIKGEAGDVKALLLLKPERLHGAIRMRKNEAGMQSEMRTEKYRIDPNRRDENGLAAIHHAVQRGNVNVVRALLERDDLDIGKPCLSKNQPGGFWKTKGWSRGQTPLQMAQMAYELSRTSNDLPSKAAYEEIIHALQRNIAGREQPPGDWVAPKWAQGPSDPHPQGLEGRDEGMDQAYVGSAADELEQHQHEPGNDALSWRDAAYHDDNESAVSRSSLP